ncbi:MAG: LruC domain-containing protein [Fibrobacterales bacterium]
MSKFKIGNVSLLLLSIVLLIACDVSDPNLKNQISEQSTYDMEVPPAFNFNQQSTPKDFRVLVTSADGQPLSDKQVEVWDKDTVLIKRGYTNANGHFFYNGTNSDEYLFVAVQEPDFDKVLYPVRLESEEELTIASHNPITPTLLKHSTITSTAQQTSSEYNGHVGRVAFEDLYPTLGDFDFNDVVMDYTIIEHTTITDNGSSLDTALSQIEFKIIPVAHGAYYDHGFAISLGHTRAPTSITINGIPQDVAAITIYGECILTFTNNIFSEYQLPANKRYVNVGAGSTQGQHTVVPYEALPVFTALVTFAPGTQPLKHTAPYKPFLKWGGSLTKQVHLPGQIPIHGFDNQYLSMEEEGTDYVPHDTLSNFRTLNNLPWAIIVNNDWYPPQENVHIVATTPDFACYVESGGTNCNNWYARPDDATADERAVLLQEAIFEEPAVPLELPSSSSEISSSSMALSSVATLPSRSSTEPIESSSSSVIIIDYPTTLIGDDAWTIKNVDYPVEGSTCVPGDESLCTTYGRYYTWDQAQTACSEGWRLPSPQDWNNIAEAIGRYFNSNNYVSQAARYLRGVSNPTGFGAWKRDYSVSNDEFKFNARALGYLPVPGAIQNLGNKALWWTSDESGEYGTFVFIDKSITWIQTYPSGNKNMQIPVRCIKE